MDFEDFFLDGAYQYKVGSETKTTVTITRITVSSVLQQLANDKKRAMQKGVPYWFRYLVKGREV